MAGNANSGSGGGAIPKTRPDDRRGARKGQTVIDGKLVGAMGGSIGVAPHIVTEEMRAKVREMAAVFPIETQDRMAMALDMSPSTLTRHYREDIDVGRAKMIAEIGVQMLRRAVNARDPNVTGDLEAQKFVLSRLGGWSLSHGAEIGLPNGQTISITITGDDAAL